MKPLHALKATVRYLLRRMISVATDLVGSDATDALAAVPPFGVASGRDLDYLDPSIPTRVIASHTTWPDYLVPLLNRPGLRVLEIGSRAVNSNGVFRRAFPQCDYVGVDLHAGMNVDVVGDVHRLTELFGENSFDAVVSSAVFEHLACPWIVAEEIAKVLRPGGLVYVETHFSHSMHELPWNFFQFSHEGLKVLFNSALGFETIESGVSNPLVARFSFAADEYLVGQQVINLYCHSGYVGRRSASALQTTGNFDWRSALDEIYRGTSYPSDTSQFIEDVQKDA
jgi:SAM-dependent methyltransferase